MIMRWLRRTVGSTSFTINKNARLWMILLLLVVYRMGDLWNVGTSTIAVVAVAVALVAVAVVVCRQRRWQSFNHNTNDKDNKTNYNTVQQKRRRRFLVLLVLFLLVALLYVLIFRVLATSLGYRPRPLPLHLRRAIHNNFNNNHDNHSNEKLQRKLLTVFLLDGLRADVLDQELRAGRLVHLQQLVDYGCRVSTVISPFPSITGYAYWPLLTGMEATRSGHLGTRYFDRSRGVRGHWRNHYGPASANFQPNFEPSVPTLLEAAATIAQSQSSQSQSQSSWTLAGNSMLQRGANYSYVASTEQYFTKMGHVWWLAQWIKRIPILRWIAPEFDDYERRYMRRILQLIKRGQPRVAWLVLPSLDNAAHAFGVHDKYRHVLREMDKAIGTYVQAIRDLNYYEEHSIAIISDHGEASVDVAGGGNLDLCPAYLQKGIKAWRGDAKHWSTTFDEPLETFGADKDLLIAIQGDASGLLYVKNQQQGWLHRTLQDELRCYHHECVDLIQTALDVKGIELMAWSRSNRVVAVQTATSAVGVIRLHDNGRISYTLEQSTTNMNANATLECPLGYLSELSNGAPRTAREWLKATHHTPFPYATVRLIQSLTVPGLAPDMIVTTREGYDLSKDWEYFIRNFAGGHGGLNRNHLTTPAIFYGEGIAPGTTVDLATAEDIGASLHSMLLKEKDENLYVPPSLEFLRNRIDQDVIAQAYYDNQQHQENNAADSLLRGTPVSCLR